MIPRPEGFVKVMRDLTERKLMEERLRARTEELMDDDRRRNNFLRMLSHELRNPLATIVTSCYLLRERLTTEDAVVIEARDMIDRQASRLKHLVDGLLDVSRLSHNRIELHKTAVDLADIAGRAAASLRAFFDEKRHELTISAEPEPIAMSADPVRLEQIISALLHNAAQYTEPGGRLELEVGREDGQAVVRVRDNGIGMEPELLERAFDLFAQSEQGLARTAGGLGVGLTMARSLARLHGGTLVGRSEGTGRGSEFVLRVPIIPPEPGENPSGVAAPAVDGDRPMAPARILLVDDNLDAARSTELVLCQAGHDVLLAHDGQDAIELALRHRPDVAILDVGLPRIDGYGVAASCGG